MGLFGKKKTLSQQLRGHKRTIDRACRDLDRERMGLENQEKRTIADIKKMAKQGQGESCKIMAKDLVRTRHYVQRFMKMRAQLQAVGLRIQTLKSTHELTQTMAGVTKAMGSMNKQLNLPGLQKIMMQFEMASEQMDMKEGMISDTIDDAFEESDEEAETDEVLQKVFDELGVSLGDELPNAPTAQAEGAQVAAPDATDDLAARLDALKK